MGFMRWFRRREPMTRKEVLRRYLEYEPAPGGGVVVSPESVDKAMREAMKLKKRGLLIEDDDASSTPDEPGETAR